MEEEDQATAAQNATAQAASNEHYSYRDMIVDRTGDLLARASAFTEEYQKPTLTLMREPGSSVDAPFLVSRENGIYPIPSAYFDDYRLAPRRRKGTAMMTRLDSFIDHVNRFKDKSSALFASDDRSAPALTSLLNYHDPLIIEGEPADILASPRFGDHRTSFKFPLSDEWKAWTAANKREMSMNDFAEFLEDRIVDVDAIESLDDLSDQMRTFIGRSKSSKIASPTRLMELATSLYVNENAVITQDIKLQSGEGQIRFETEHTDGAGAPVDIPGLFVICIPVFRHDGFYRILARLRYRARGGLTFWFELWRADLIFDHAFEAACAKVKDATGLPLFVGAPE